jgi:hypothetical protein
MRAEKEGWRRGMELNHQTRLCRPFPEHLGSAPSVRLLRPIYIYISPGTREANLFAGLLRPAVTGSKRKQSGRPLVGGRPDYGEH